MNEDQQRILELTYFLAKALGALEMVSLSQHDFNLDGLKLVIEQLRKALEESEWPKKNASKPNA